MTQPRRAVAALVALLTIPSVYWVVTRPLAAPETGWQADWIRELMFIVGLLASAAMTWRASRYWQFVLPAVLAVATYLIAWKFIQEVLLVPAHWSHFRLVIEEAMRRGFNGGPRLVWSLLILPLALPIALFAALWLSFASQTAKSVNVR